MVKLDNINKKFMNKSLKIIIPIILILLIGILGYYFLASKTKTALLSFTEFFCYLTEQSEPYAYFQFAYQEDGQIKYIKTKTTCDDLIKLGATNDAAKNPTLIGEQIKLEYYDGKPVRVIREDGNIYLVENSDAIRSFFRTGINVYDNQKYFKNSNSEKVVAECLLIKDSNQHDKCLSFQAAFQKDTKICDILTNPSNQDLCKEWVNNIKDGKVN